MTRHKRDEKGRAEAHAIIARWFVLGAVRSSWPCSCRVAALLSNLRDARQVLDRPRRGCSPATKQRRKQPPMGSRMFHRPQTVDDALALLAAAPARLLAGGTDVYPALGERQLSGPVIDLTAITALRGISRNGETWRIGAATRWRDIRDAFLPPGFAALQQAAREIGSVQIQNSGTIAGNICNASPAADGVPPLLILDAEVEIASATGTRVLPLSDFITGYRRTALQPGEIVTAILVRDAAAQSPSNFLKLGARKYLVISIAMVAAQFAVENGVITEARVAIGACSAVAMRIRQLEQDLTGAPVHVAAERIQPQHFSDLTPIDDVRATAQYRRDAAMILVRRALAAGMSA